MIEQAAPYAWFLTQMREQMKVNEIPHMWNLKMA
jgi:hypothetical protein